MTLISLKTEYEHVMAQFEAAGQVFTYSAQESQAILEELNKGMDDFLQQQTKAEIGSMRTARHVILNA